MSSIDSFPEQEQSFSWASIIPRGFARQKASQLQRKGCRTYKICSCKPVEVDLACRWSGMDAGDDDMCRTSSAVATPESSYATARAVPVSVSHPSVSSGHSSRKGHLPPVYTTSPVIQDHRYCYASDRPAHHCICMPLKIVHIHTRGSHVCNACTILLVSHGDVIAVNLSQSSHAACTVLVYTSKHCVL